MTSARAHHRHEDKSRLSSAEGSFLRGGGEMGERIRAYDWSATPLGPPNQWPLPLRTAVRILLTTNHPVFLFWGRELHCFYNDAYSRSLGPEKHPGMLGATGREAWAEIWDIIGSQIDYVMSGQGSTWHENHLVPITRHGKREDVYWTYSYSPIDDPEASHGVGGVLVLCTETTEQVFAAERLRADLSERQRIEQMVRGSEEALRHAGRRKDEFLATLAHELRNPLAPLRNALTALRLTRNPETLVDARAIMERQLEHLIRLVDDLLDVSRITTGRIELRTERVSISSVLESAIETSHPLIEASGHALEVNLPREALFVDADATRLCQVFANILNNAAKYTPYAGHISLAARREGDNAVVTIEDDGVGIPPEMLPRVFELFTQVDRSLERTQGGLGIGLSLVQRLVELHGGSVEASSPGLGKGSRFTVRLPLQVEPDKRITAAPEAGAATSPHRRRVLVVDDNHDAALSLAMVLEMKGNHAWTAHDGIEALDMAAEFQPEVVLLDIGMPRLNGHDVARRIREQPSGKAMVLIALTGWSQEADRDRSIAAGFDLHMTKPIDFDQLEQVLESLNPLSAGG